MVVHKLEWPITVVVVDHNCTEMIYIHILSNHIPVLLFSYENKKAGVAMAT